MVIEVGGVVKHPIIQVRLLFNSNLAAYFLHEKNT
jgi:hypothetical protein